MISITIRMTGFRVRSITWAVCAIPIGDNYTMGPDDALRAGKMIAPKHVIPIHYGTWEVITQNPDDWAARVRKETRARVHVLKPGESFSL